MVKARKKNTGLAKSLRKNQTEVECFLWQYLRAKRLSGHKFRRQHPIGNYILDFYCPEKKLAIEVDGGQHGEGNQMYHDQKRTADLEKNGICVLRYWDYEVLTNTNGILDDIIQELESR
jgi:very-short-patch-repair endonuclease